LLAAACAKTTTPDPGTNTNWLKTCDSEADCDEADSCVCGVCTKPCSDEVACGAVHAATSCRAVETDACGASSAAMACLQTCDERSDCTSLENGRCVSHVCVPETESSTLDASDRDATMSPEDAGPNLYALTRDERNVVQITDAYTGCSSSNQCVIVETSCDGCCGQGTIVDELSDTYETNFALACEGIVNGGCPCDTSPLVAACRDEHCVALDPLDACYSPSQNLDLAYRPNARGCDCPTVGQSICISPAALVCEVLDGNPPEPRWIAVEDGPCGEPEPDPSCADGEVRETAEACLADFMTCYELTSGEFCGVNP
jgi:hypothetical protein